MTRCPDNLAQGGCIAHYDLGAKVLQRTGKALAGLKRMQARRHVLERDAVKWTALAGTVTLSTTGEKSK